MPADRLCDVATHARLVRWVWQRSTGCRRKATATPASHRSAQGGMPRGVCWYLWPDYRWPDRTLSSTEMAQLFRSFVSGGPYWAASHPHWAPSHPHWARNGRHWSEKPWHWNPWQRRSLKDLVTLEPVTKGDHWGTRDIGTRDQRRALGTLQIVAVINGTFGHWLAEIARAVQIWEKQALAFMTHILLYAWPWAPCAGTLWGLGGGWMWMWPQACAPKRPPSPSLTYLGHLEAWAGFLPLDHWPGCRLDGGGVPTGGVLWGAGGGGKEGQSWLLTPCPVVKLFCLVLLCTSLSLSLPLSPSLSLSLSLSLIHTHLCPPQFSPADEPTSSLQQAPSPPALRFVMPALMQSLMQAWQRPMTVLHILAWLGAVCSRLLIHV